jgi:hypothetical protein
MILILLLLLHDGHALLSTFFVGLSPFVLSMPVAICFNRNFVDMYIDV